MNQCGLKLFSFFSISLGQQLDSNLLWLIALRITNETQLRTLAVQGLHLENHVIDSTVNAEKRTNLAARFLLKKWRDAERNSRVAFRNLYDIFERVNMSLIMSEALKACKQ